jgi:hypothetical protein
VLAREEEVVVLMEECPMKSYEGLPLLVVEFVANDVGLGVLGIVDLYTLTFDHYKASIDAFDLGDELLLRDGPCLGLLDEDRGSVLSRRPIAISGTATTPGRGMTCPGTSWWWVLKTSPMSSSDVGSVDWPWALRFTTRSP